MLATAQMTTLMVIVVLGCSGGFAASIRGQQSTEKTALGGRKPQLAIPENEKLSPLTSATAADPLSGLVEVAENEIPEGTLVYVLDEIDAPQPDGETLKTADNIVFRPLFSYRSRQEALARRRAGNGYRRRYFVPRRPYRDTYYYYYPGYRSY